MKSSLIYELKNKGTDLLEEGTAGHKVVSHVVFDELPMEVRKELVHRLSNNYPTVTDIFANYNEVIKTLSKICSVKRKTFNKTFTKPSTGFSNTLFKYNNNKESDDTTKYRSTGKGNSTIQNFKSVNTNMKKFTCKVCSASDHSLGKCVNFSKYGDKIARLKDLSLCIRCAGSGHNENNCYGKQNKLRFEC